MEFQNQPFQDLKERVAELEKKMEFVERRLELLNRFGPVRVTAAEPSPVPETQDDARRKPFFKTVEKVQEEKESRS